MHFLRSDPTLATGLFIEPLAFGIDMPPPV
jgi:hypothetical protein